MDEFKKKLVSRQILFFVGLIVLGAAFLFSEQFGTDATASPDLADFISGVQAGCAAALLVVMVVFIVKYFMAMQSPDKLKSLYISETDERKLFIQQKTGGIGMNIIGYGLIAGTVISGNLNDIVFFTLLGTTFFVAVVRSFFEVYYRKKY